jgi:ubiquinone/menaquinone biosynthesis C-methylase UbiE
MLILSEESVWDSNVGFDPLFSIHCNAKEAEMKPHFVRDYNRMIRHLVQVEPSYEVAMARAVGGGPYIEVGKRARRVLESLGLQDTHYVIDIGAGSGRLTTALKDLPNLRYLGTDVVPELLDFARKKCGRNDWTFKLVEMIEIPEEDRVADFVVFFSVFTHLTEDDCYHYLQEAKRVLGRNGTIVVSFLDPNVAAHARQAGKSWTQRRWWTQRFKRIIGRGSLTTLLSRKTLDNWSKELNLSIEYVDDPADIGQSLCAYRRPREGRKRGE